jgi:hypothetical protein
VLSLGLPFSDKKIIPRNTKQDGTDDSSVGIPPISRKRKTSEFHSEPFLGREKPLEFRSKPFRMIKPWNSFPNHFSKRKLRNSIPNHFRKKKTRNSIPNHFRKRKHFKIRSKPFLEQKTLEKRRLLLAVSQNFIIFTEFRFVPFGSEK